MGLRHVVVIDFTEDATLEQRQALVDGLRALPGLVPDIRRYAFGPDAAISEGNHDFAVVADFDDAAGFHAYQSHPAHQRVLVELLRPILASRAAVQFET